MPLSAKICCKCGLYNVEDIHHIMLKNPGLSEEREGMHKELYERCVQVRGIFEAKQEQVFWWPMGKPTVQTFNFCNRLPDVCQCLVVQKPMDNMSKNKPSTSITHVDCELKLHPVVRSSMHPCPGNWVAIRRVVMYNVWAAQAFSA